jgi:predicted Rdx family selenoprotein
MKIAPHVHSEWSYDASWTLERIAAEFGRRGYGAVLMAEHDRGFDAARWDAYRQACADASAESSILLVPGIEYGDASDDVHVAVWGSDRFLGAGVATGDLLEAAAVEHAVAVLAHPERRGAFRMFRKEWAQHLAGVEIWNRKYDGWAPGARAVALARAELLRPFVGLDFHTERQFFALALVVAGGVTTPTGVVDALRAGDVDPRVFGQVATRFTRGAPGVATSAAERVRRALRPVVRRVRAKRR